MRYEFLLLSVLFLLPGALIFLTRADLRPVMGRMAFASLPFATTEWLFYPHYWRPAFLFDLADVIGFGIEDVLFVVGLSAFASTMYPVVFRRTPVAQGRPTREPWLRASFAIAVALGTAFILLGVGVPVLYASVVAMLSVAVGMLSMRVDLIVPSLIGALLSTLVYFVLALVFASLVPGVFERTWRPSMLLAGWKLLGVPVDELLYGFGAGFVGTCFPAWAFGFVYRRRPRGADAPAFTHGREVQ